MDAKPTPAMVEAAADWLAHLESGDATDADRDACETWRGQHPGHAAALDRLGGLGARLGAEGNTLRALFPGRGRRTAPTLLALVGVAGAAWFALQSPALEVHFADVRAPTGEILPVALADGSRLVLATDSAANLDVTVDRRSIRLLRGEVFAEVADDAAAPFIISTEDGTARALGTAFTVRKEPGATRISVLESHVEVCPAAGVGCMTLGPGQRALVTQASARRLPDAPTPDIGAWTEGWLPLDDKPLVEVLDELNRWRDQPIRFDRARLSGLRVSGVLPLRDTDRALANLTLLLPLVVDRSDPASPTVAARRP